MNSYRMRATGQVVTEQQYREQHTQIFPDVLVPLDADPILESPPPSVGANQIAVRDGIKQDSLGNWVVDWDVRNKPQEQIDAQIATDKTSRWEDIKAERDRRKAGGVLVGGKWYHSDDSSRIQWLGLKDSARDMLATGGTLTSPVMLLGSPVLWKTLDGSFQPVNVQLAFDVTQTTKELDARAFLRAEQHRAAMSASANPASYDISTGWPAIYPGT